MKEQVWTLETRGQRASEKDGQPSECEGRSVVPCGNFRPRIEMLLR